MEEGLLAWAIIGDDMPPTLQPKLVNHESLDAYGTARVRLVGADPDLSAEASLAALSIAEQLADTYPARVKRAATLVLSHCERPDLIKRARALRGLPAP